MSDTFKSVGSQFEIFQDGETVQARKLGTIITAIQEGCADLERAIGDIFNLQMPFYSTPLFQNSVARVLGSLNSLDLQVPHSFIQDQVFSDALHQGFFTFPYAGNLGACAANLSMNLIPSWDQEDKLGVGCTWDDGVRCLGGLSTLYDREKSLLRNSLFEKALADWDFQNAVWTGASVNLSASLHWNCLPYSDLFEQWILSGNIKLQPRQITDPFGSSNGYLIETIASTTASGYLELSGLGDVLSRDWTFSLYGALPVGCPDTHLFLEISGLPDTTNGDQFGGVVTSGCWSIPLVSGETLVWNRYWVHARFAGEVSPPVVRIYANYGHYAESPRFYIAGAQLEPTYGPTVYCRTSGTAISGVAEFATLGQNVTIIPGHQYQATLQVSGNRPSVLRLGSQFIANIVNGLNYVPFVASADLTPENQSLVLQTEGLGNMVVSKFRLDAGMPCQAMNCPLHSAYGKIRNYRTVLPLVTLSNVQKFGQRIFLPEGIRASQSQTIPANILGIYDHTLNHSVPDTLVNWKLTDWSLSTLSRSSLMKDPEFLTDWSTSGLDTFPTELTPHSVYGGQLQRDTSLGLDIDRLIIMAGSGETKGIQRTFLLHNPGTYIWEYRIRGAMSHSGISEQYIQNSPASGILHVDFDGSGSWTEVPVAGGLSNSYRVDGDLFPGESTCATENNRYWTIQRLIRLDCPNVPLTLRIDFESHVSGAKVYLDSFNLRQPANDSAIMTYRGAPPLGCCWMGSLTHVLDENLLTWSDQPSYWAENHLAEIDESQRGWNGQKVVRITMPETGYLKQFVPASVFKDTQASLQFDARAIFPSPISVQLEQDSLLLLSQSVQATSEWQSFCIPFSSISLTPTAAPISVRFHCSGTIELSKIQIHHGSGMVNYVATQEKPIETYRYLVRLYDAGNLQNFSNGYLLVWGLPTQVVLQENSNGDHFKVVGGNLNQEFKNFPDAGVLRVKNQNFLYRTKTSEGFGACLPAWGGSEFDSSVLTSGNNITHVPLPVAIEEITGSGSERLARFRSLLPVSNGAWTAGLQGQLFDLGVSRLGRFSMTSSAVSVAQTLASLISVFVDHVSDDNEHFRIDQICDAIINLGQWAQTPDMSLDYYLSKSVIQEGYPVTLKLYSYGLMAGTNKVIEVDWGDGTSSEIFSETGSIFGPYEHVYTIPRSNMSQGHTIKARLEDSNFGIVLQAATGIIVTPHTKAIHSASATLRLIHEAQQIARSVLQVPITAQQKSRTYLS